VTEDARVKLEFMRNRGSCGKNRNTRVTDIRNKCKDPEA
jgi:hypothetical protein